MSADNPIAHHLRLTKPCENCPFRREGAIELREGRVEGIVEGLLADDRSTFHCHKTVHSKGGGRWDAKGRYKASGKEAMCAGAAAVLMKRGRPTVAMRLAFTAKIAEPARWIDLADDVID